MNKKILQKCLEELSKEEPRIDYIKGMLETSYEMLNEDLPIVPPTVTRTPNSYLQPTFTSSKSDEELTLAQQSYLNGPIGHIS